MTYRKFRPFIQLLYPRPACFRRKIHLNSYVCCDAKMEQLKENPFYDKYAEKLNAMQRDNAKAFDEKIEDLSAKKKADEKQALEMAAEMKKTHAKQRESLNSVMKVELLQDKTSDEIEQIWTEYHRNRDCVFSVMKSEEFQTLQQRWQQFPVFVYPLPRAQGYEFMLQHCRDSTVSFTPLQVYKEMQDRAVSCLSLRHYTDLMDSKGVVLMVGTPDSKQLGIHEAQLLAMQHRLYYSSREDSARLRLLQQFHANPDAFSHLELVREFERFKENCQEDTELFKHGTPV